PGDQWLLSLPLYHVGGLGIIFRAFQGGGSVVIPGPDKPIDQMLKSHKITHLSLVPTQFTRLLRDADCHNALKNLKVILLGGSAIPDSLISDAIKLRLPVYTTYGSTEMASQVATSGRLSEDNPISAGKVLNYRRLMISEEGKILVKGETLFKGYIEKEGMVLPFNENGYFVTGDLGEFSDDGRLIVNGRKDNMFFSGGENIQPEEIERYLCRVKSVERAIVVPVAHQEYGFRPVAFIKASAPMTRKGILNILENDLPKFKIPEEFYLWPENEETDDLKASRRYFTHRIAQHPSSFTSIK
ncbi:MAG: AMP-binding protein, partial [Candidatus Omnitrophica bacterium]|nr:AMP-binding protein [Candidatus Omnitrophota bacterium]